MTDSRPNDDAHRPIDPERPRDGHPFDGDDHFSGQTYRREREQAAGDRQRDPKHVDRTDQRDIPPDDGARASVAKDGSVHGSGVGIGGGNPGEDLDSSSASGDHEVIAGGESRDGGGDGRPGDLGPKTDTAPPDGLEG